MVSFFWISCISIILQVLFSSMKSGTCWVPFQHVLCVFEAPCLVSGLRQYQMMAAFARTVENASLNYKC